MMFPQVKVEPRNRGSKTFKTDPSYQIHPRLSSYGCASDSSAVTTVAAHPRLRVAIPPILSQPKGGRLRLPGFLVKFAGPDAARRREAGRRTNAPLLRVVASSRLRSTLGGEGMGG